MHRFMNSKKENAHEYDTAEREEGIELHAMQCTVNLQLNK